MMVNNSTRKGTGNSAPENVPGNCKACTECQIENESWVASTLGANTDIVIVVCFVLFMLNILIKAEKVVSIFKKYAKTNSLMFDAIREDGSNLVKITLTNDSEQPASFIGHGIVVSKDNKKHLYKDCRLRVDYDGANNEFEYIGHQKAITIDAGACANLIYELEPTPSQGQKLQCYLFEGKNKQVYFDVKESVNEGISDKDVSTGLSYGNKKI